MQKRGAGKGHQPHPVTFEHGQQVENLPLGTFQAVRPDVGGGHGPGAVQCDDDVHALLTNLLPAVAVSGAGQGHGDKEHRAHEQTPLDPPSAADRFRSDSGKAVGGSKAV